MSKEWKMIEWDSCPECGSIPEVLSECKGNDMVMDSEEARCPECDMRGGTTVDEDGNAYINWND